MLFRPDYQHSLIKVSSSLRSENALGQVTERVTVIVLLTASTAKRRRKHTDGSGRGRHERRARLIPAW